MVDVGKEVIDCEDSWCALIIKPIIMDHISDRIASRMNVKVVLPYIRHSILDAVEMASRIGLSRTPIMYVTAFPSQNLNDYLNSY